MAHALGFALIVAVAAALIAIEAFGGAWPICLMTPFLPQLGLLAASGCLLQATAARRRRAAAHLAVLAVGLLACAHLLLIELCQSRAGPAALRGIGALLPLRCMPPMERAAAAPETTLGVLVCNVHSKNRDFARTLQLIGESDAEAWPVVAGSKTALGGWCHGAPGTGRLYLLLHQITGEKRFLDTAIASARWVMAQAPAAAKGSPVLPPSFCCGVAGVLDFFCDLYRVTRDAEFAAFADRAGEYLIAAARPDSEGVKWPKGAVAHGKGGGQHGLDLMLGAPGEALALLRLMTLDVRPDPVSHLPDRHVGTR